MAASLEPDGDISFRQVGFHSSVLPKHSPGTEETAVQIRAEKSR